jgi:hypothetical protein
MPSRETGIIPRKSFDNPYEIESVDLFKKSRERQSFEKR